MPAHSSSSDRRRLGAIAIFGLAVLLGAQLPGLIRPPASNLGDTDLSPPKRERKILSALTASIPMPAVSNHLLAADPDVDDPDGMNTVEAILSDSGLSTSQKAQALLAAIDHLSGAPAIAACEQALLRLKSESYEAAFAKLVSDGVEMGVRQSIMADLMDRSDFLRLPLLGTPRQPAPAAVSRRGKGRVDRGARGRLWHQLARLVGWCSQLPRIGFGCHRGRLPAVAVFPQVAAGDPSPTGCRARGKL